MVVASKWLITVWMGVSVLQHLQELLYSSLLMEYYKYWSAFYAAVPYVNQLFKLALLFFLIFSLFGLDFKCFFFVLTNKVYIELNWCFIWTILKWDRIDQISLLTSFWRIFLWMIWVTWYLMMCHAMFCMLKVFLYQTFEWIKFSRNILTKFCKQKNY